MTQALPVYFREDAFLGNSNRSCKHIILQIGILIIWTFYQCIWHLYYAFQFITNLLPLLEHNEILRLRRVSHQTKQLADDYLWTPKPGYQGKWELKLKPNQRTGKTLRKFRRIKLPPPSRILIKFRLEKSDYVQSFYDDKQVLKFMIRYGNYVTHLNISHIGVSPNETDFLKCFPNLETLICDGIWFTNMSCEHTNAFQCLSFQKLRRLLIKDTDCEVSMRNFIARVVPKLEIVCHPYNQAVGLKSSLDFGLQLFGMLRNRDFKSTFYYDWRNVHSLMVDPKELLRFFATCYDCDVHLKKVHAYYMDFMLCDENGFIGAEENLEHNIQQPIPGLQNIRRNSFVGNIIYSLDGLKECVFLTEMENLEKIKIHSLARCRFPTPNAYPKWPKLRKLDMVVDTNEYEGVLQYICGFIERKNLHEFVLRYPKDVKSVNGVNIEDMSLPCPVKLGKFCPNITKLTVKHCFGDNLFFASLWAELSQLSSVHLSCCPNLGNEGFIGMDIGKKQPAFLELKSKYANIIITYSGE